MDQSTSSRRIAALLPSLTDILFLMPVAMVLARYGGVSGIIEGDTGWHVRTGEWMLANGRIPDADMFSFTRPGERWFAWEWLWDLGFGWLHREFGMAAVVLGSIATICLTSALLFRLTLRQCGYRFVAAAFTFVAAGVTSLHWWARPHLFTWLFMVITLWVIEWKRSGERDLLWTLPLLTAVWVNVHGGWFVTLLLLGSYAAGELSAAAFEAKEPRRQESLRRAVPYAITAAGCLAASFANPYTYHLHGHLLGYMSNPDSPFFRQVGEWQSISFHAPVARFVEIMLVAGLAAAFWHAAHRRFAYLLLTLGWMHLGLTSGRHLPLFGIVAAPMAAQAAVEAARRVRRSGVALWVGRTFDRIRAAEFEFGEIDSLPRLYVASAAGLAVVGMLMAAPEPGERFRPDFNQKHYPAKAIESMPASAFGGKLFAPDEWGDYLIYRLYPKTRVFVDGRFDFYGEKHTQDYLDILDVKYDWQARLAKYGIDAVLLPAGLPLSSTMKESGLWIPVYDDGVAILFHSRERFARGGGVQPSSAAPRSAGEAQPPGGSRSETGHHQTQRSKSHESDPQLHPRG
jgi:hypothetical protein